MKILDLTPTDLTKNIIGLLVVVAYLWLTIQEMSVPTQLEIAFFAVLAVYGISAAKPAVSNLLTKVYGKPQDARTDK